MLSPHEINQIQALVKATSERKAAKQLGITLAVLQRAIPLPISDDNERLIRTALSTQPVMTCLNGAAPNGAAPNGAAPTVSKLEAQLVLLRERERLRAEREERQAARKGQERQRRAEEHQSKRLLEYDITPMTDEEQAEYHRQIQLGKEEMERRAAIQPVLEKQRAEDQIRSVEVSVEMALQYEWKERVEAAKSSLAKRMPKMFWIRKVEAYSQLTDQYEIFAAIQNTQERLTCQHTSPDKFGDVPGIRDMLRSLEAKFRQFPPPYPTFQLSLNYYESD